MPLAKNKISVPFSSGLQTKTDVAQDQLSGFRTLENVIFDTPNKLLKRRGYSLINTKLIGNIEIEDPKFLANFKDELGLFTSTNYYSRSTSLDKFTDKGKVFTAIPSSAPVVRTTREQHRS